MASQLTKDLVVAFGFSKSNAASAVWLYRNGKLNIQLSDDLFHLERHPWSGNNCEREMPTVRHGMIERLEKLNYQITEAGGKPV